MSRQPGGGSGGEGGGQRGVSLHSAAVGSWQRRSPRHIVHTRSGPSSRGSGTWCGGSGQTESHPYSYTADSGTLGYLQYTALTLHLCHNTQHLHYTSVTTHSSYTTSVTTHSTYTTPLSQHTALTLHLCHNTQHLHYTSVTTHSTYTTPVTTLFLLQHTYTMSLHTAAHLCILSISPTALCST